VDDTETLQTVGGRSVLRLERRLAHRPEKVWRAVTEPGQLAAWFPSQVEMPELTVGGKVRFVFADDEAPPSEGIITEVDEPRTFAFTWGDNEIRIDLSPGADDDSCVLVFTQVFDDTAGAASFAAGWDNCLAALAAELDGDDPASGDLDAGHESFVERFDLDQGTAVDTSEGWEVRFERQLVRPIETTWNTALGTDTPPTAHGPVPAGFTADGIEAGPVSDVDPPTKLAYGWRHQGEPAGHITWTLTDGTGHGARLTVTQSGPADLSDARATALTAWRDRIESLAHQLLSVPKPTD
jgi:uncharacterized protein YndB with AHSA1/START domain